MSKMNNRGDLASALLPIIALVMSVLALFIFITFNGDFSDVSESISQSLEQAAFNQVYVKETARIITREAIAGAENAQDVRVKIIDIANSKQVLIDGTSEFYSKLKDGEFEVARIGDGKYSFLMREVRVYSDRGGNKIVRKFDIAFEITKDEAERALVEDITPPEQTNPAEGLELRSL